MRRRLLLFVLRIEATMQRCPWLGVRVPKLEEKHTNMCTVTCGENIFIVCDLDIMLNIRHKCEKANNMRLEV